MKIKEWCTVISQEEIGKDIYSMWLQTEQIGKEAKAGQFISLYTGEGSKLLPRPISLCEIDSENSRLRIVYRVTGAKTGTEIFSRMKEGGRVEVLGPLGNGFPLEEAQGKKVFLMGGGIGIPPMVETAKQIAGDVTVIAGYRDELFLTEELEKAGYEMKAMEGYRAGNWVLLDFNDIIIHVFDRENRLFYDLERIWKDGREVKAQDLGIEVQD